MSYHLLPRKDRIECRYNTKWLNKYHIFKAIPGNEWSRLVPVEETLIECFNVGGFDSVIVVDVLRIISQSSSFTHTVSRNIMFCFVLSINMWSIFLACEKWELTKVFVIKTDVDNWGLLVDWAGEAESHRVYRPSFKSMTRWIQLT